MSLLKGQKTLGMSLDRSYYKTSCYCRSRHFCLMVSLPYSLDIILHLKDVKSSFKYLLLWPQIYYWQQLWDEDLNTILHLFLKFCHKGFQHKTVVLKWLLLPSQLYLVELLSLLAATCNRWLHIRDWNGIITKFPNLF